MNLFKRIDERIRMFFSSDAEFEREIEVSPKTVDKWRRGDNESYKKKISPIAKALGTTSAYLLCETDDPTPPKERPATDKGDGVNESELEHIKKYRALDERGQKAVDDTLTREYEFAMRLKKLREQKEALPMAARDGGVKYLTGEKAARLLEADAKLGNSPPHDFGKDDEDF